MRSRRVFINMTGDDMQKITKPFPYILDVEY
jgi:hypothetical protein